MIIINKGGDITWKNGFVNFGYEYDEATGDSDNGIAAGTKFEDIPEDWVCPLCGAGKSEFKKS